MVTNQSFCPIAVLAAIVALGPGSSCVAASEARVTRYSEVYPSPSKAQRDPLLSQVQSRVPDELNQVGDAVDWLLVPAGYRLAAERDASLDLAGFMALPLPDVHRSLEGLPVRTALQTLAGPAFMLVEDPVHRLVSFQSCRDSMEGY